MKRSTVGLALAMAFVAGMRLLQGDPVPTGVAIGFAALALYETRINAKCRKLAMWILRKAA
jgi:hypothetical protein